MTIAFSSIISISFAALAFCVISCVAKIKSQQREIQSWMARTLDLEASGQALTADHEAEIDTYRMKLCNLKEELSQAHACLTYALSDHTKPMNADQLRHIFRAA